MKGDKLTDKQKAFCREYVKNGYNGTQAAIKAGYSIKGADAEAGRLLVNVRIREKIDYYERNLDELLCISKAKVMNEHMKIGFSSIAHLHNTWITRKAFEDLTDEQKACIQEITADVKTKSGENGDVIEEYVKIKLYDKQKSLDAIAKLRGYDAPQRFEAVINEKTEVSKLFPFAPPSE